MLEVTGCVGDTLKIGPETTVLVLGVAGDAVQLGIATPHKLGAQPAEVCQLIQAVRAQAVAGKQGNPKTE